MTTDRFSCILVKTHEVIQKLLGNPVDFEKIGSFAIRSSLLKYVHLMGVAKEIKKANTIVMSRTMLPTLNIVVMLSMLFVTMPHSTRIS